MNRPDRVDALEKALREIIKQVDMMSTAGLFDPDWVINEARAALEPADDDAAQCSSGSIAVHAGPETEHTGRKWRTGDR